MSFNLEDGKFVFVCFVGVYVFLCLSVYMCVCVCVCVCVCESVCILVMGQILCQNGLIFDQESNAAGLKLASSIFHEAMHMLVKTKLPSVLK